MVIIGGKCPKCVSQTLQDGADIGRISSKVFNRSSVIQGSDSSTIHDKANVGDA